MQQGNVNSFFFFFFQNLPDLTYIHTGFSIPLFIDTQFRMSILERLEQMEQRMAEITNQNPNSETSASKSVAMEGGGGASDQQSQVNINKVLVCTVLNLAFKLLLQASNLTQNKMSQPCIYSIHTDVNQFLEFPLTSRLFNNSSSCV